MAFLQGSIWMDLITIFHFQLHDFMTHFQHCSWSILDLFTSFDGPITRPCIHASENYYFWHFDGSVWKSIALPINSTHSAQNWGLLAQAWILQPYPSPLEDKLEGFQLKIEFQFHFCFEVETPRIQAILWSNSLPASFWSQAKANWKQDQERFKLLEGDFS